MNHITIASRGICNPQWLEKYYPQDLPNDWRLDYFANDFPACVLTLREIQQLGLQLQKLHENMPTGFTCYLEVEHLSCESLPQRMPASISGIILTDENAPNENALNRLKSYDLPIGLIMANEQTVTDNDVNQVLENFPTCHLSEDMETLDCTLLNPASNPDLRQLKNVLMDLKNEPSRSTLLILDFDTEIEAFRSISTLAQLL